MNDLIPFEQVERMAMALGQRGMFGKKPEELLPLMLIAQAEGRHPAAVAMEFDIIQGRPAINSKSALARFQASGGRIQWNKRTDTEASATFEHPAGGSVEITWTMKRAEQANLTGKPTWKQYPAQMLAARVIAEGVRAVYPACLSGFYTNEEVTDMPPLPAMRNVTPVEQEGTATASDPRVGEIYQQFEDYIASKLLTVGGAQKLREVMDAGETGLDVLEALLAKAKKAHDAARAKAEPEKEIY
jgi:hypothetical protein